MTADSAALVQSASTSQSIASDDKERVRHLAQIIYTALDDGKAEDIVTIDLDGNSSVTDLLVIASGRSDRQVIALADRVTEALRQNGIVPLGIEGKTTGDWVLIDGGDAIIHIFRPEVRSYYNLEKMWGNPAPVISPMPASPPASPPASLAP